jgi:hypothetical protein
MRMRELHQRQRRHPLEQQLREETVAAEAAEADALVATTQVEEEDEDDADFDWSDDDRPDLEEAAMQQRALLES